MVNFSASKLIHKIKKKKENSLCTVKETPDSLDALQEVKRLWGACKSIQCDDLLLRRRRRRVAIGARPAVDLRISRRLYSTYIVFLLS